MSKLSKQVIESIAEKMTAQTEKAVKQLETDYKELVTSLYEQQIPQAVKTFAKQYPLWIHFINSVKLDGHGFNWEYVSTTRPVIKPETGHSLLNLDAKIAAKIKTTYNKWVDAKKQYKLLVAETVQALSALGTHNRIKENLPEAAPYLPPPMSNALVVNFGSLQKKLKAQPDTKKIAAITN